MKGLPVEQLPILGHLAPHRWRRPVICSAGRCLLALSICGQTSWAFPLEESAKAQEHAKRGIELFHAGDLSGAEFELRKAADLSSRDPAILTYLGSVLGAQGKMHESSDYFERALEIEPGNPTIRRNLAANQWQMGQLQEAEENLGLILKAAPRDKQALLLRGMVAERMGNFVHAAQCFESAEDLVNQRAESLAALARSYYKTGRPLKARDTLAILSRHPAGPQGVFVGARIAAEAGDSDTAEMMFTSVSDTYPDPAALGYNLALVRYKAGRLEESRDTLLELIERGHGSSEIYILLGWCYHEQKKLNEAVGAFERAIAISPSDETAYLDFAKVLVKHKQLPGALNVAQRGVEKLPSSHALYLMKGTIESKLNHHLDSVDSFAQALRIDPSSVEANRELAGAQFRAGMLEEAEATFQKALRQHPTDALTYQDYALLLLKRAENGDSSARSRAVTILKKAFSLDGSLPEPHYQLGSLALEDGRYAEAARYFEEAAKLDPKSSKVHYALSRTYRRLGRPKDADNEREIYKRLQAEEE